MGSGDIDQSSNITKHDNASLMMFISEGRMFGLLLDHQQRYPKSSPWLMFCIVPFCALTVHDSGRFVRRHFDPDFPSDTQLVTRLRSASKSLSSKEIHVDQYVREVNNIVRYLTSKAKSNQGVFSKVLNAMQHDVSITYYNDTLITTTYNIARYIYNGDVECPKIDNELVGQLGFDIGSAASIHYETVKLLDFEKSALVADEFRVTNAEFHYSDLERPLAGKGISDHTCFFLLSEILTQINSVIALYDARFIDEALKIKYATAVLYSANNSINKFTGWIMKDSLQNQHAIMVTDMLSQVVDRTTRKTIKQSKMLRNALVHYNFVGLLGDSIIENEDSAEAIMGKAIDITVHMTADEYLDWLDDSMRHISHNISSLLELPGC